MPVDDAVLEQAPSHLMLHFPVAVRLVKLTLRNELRDWVDIGFRYDPVAVMHFQRDLPVLGEAEYYTVEWAILDESERLVRGSFSFTFGADAQAPSMIRAEQARLLQERYGDPSIRYVMPPPTQIIIDQDPPSYDPPFTIDLENQDPGNA